MQAKTSVAAILLAAVAIIFCAPSDSLAIYLQGTGSDHYEYYKHDRFYTGADRAFIGEPYDWSGVGHADGQWATMISPTYFVSASHYAPSGTLTFYEGNTTSTGAHSYTIAGGYSMPGADLWLGRLAAPISAADNIAYYPVLVLGANSNYTSNGGMEIWSMGSTSLVGRNNIHSIYTGYSTTRAMIFDFDATGGVGPDEAYMTSGDSGGPTFALWNNKLALLGTHWRNNGDVYDGAYSVDSFVPYHVGQLNANMGLERVTVVPEPATLSLLALGGLAVLRRGSGQVMRRRRYGVRRL